MARDPKRRLPLGGLVVFSFLWCALAAGVFRLEYGLILGASFLPMVMLWPFWSVVSERQKIAIDAWAIWLACLWPGWIVGTVVSVMMK